LEAHYTILVSKRHAAYNADGHHLCY